MSEGPLAARVLDTLLREDYAGMRRYLDADHRTLDLPGGGDGEGRTVRLREGGFLTDLVVDPAQGIRLDEVFAAVRRLADPRDDVTAFERECRETAATLRLHENARPEVMDRLAHAPDDLRHGPGTFYETLAAYTDHPVYPTGRCRSGLTTAELRRYAPEFGPSFELAWAAVPHARVTAAGVRPEWWPAPEDLGLDTDSDVFPVHPLTAPLIRTDPTLAVADERHLRVRPTLSMRTVAVTSLTHLKLPLPTSTLGLRNRRTIVPGTLPDGARVERLLHRVLEQEHLPILLADEQTYGHAGTPLLGHLVRRFPAETARAHVVPVAALLAEDPAGGHVIERWNVRETFDAYLDALFRWNVVLFRYGIALEAHQQNVSLVLDDDRMLKLLLKDNDGALIDPDRLRTRLPENEQTTPYALHDARMMTHDREALARVFVTITLHLCAAALAFGLAERGLLPLRTGLCMIRERLDAALGPGDAFLRARTLDADRLPTKAMVTAGTLVDKARTGAADINKHYGPLGPNYLRDGMCS
ncbi:IucA/IucC family protein [Actinomadura barringtoniae]|uniref:IucA/IucC family protein n=1 Tax=Actinomadura barringtoniae TaxID=1427535 RepID=A0A939T9H2_9ACTN|nr:IucA/IucC family protein [Actinomadura barringtoniae]MBO2455153.1 IucA/IucC family protein [Actinomadura barringtoniae]